MDAQALATVSAAVVALTQLLKWALIPDRYGPIAVLVLAAFGVAFHTWSVGDFVRANAFNYFAGWIVVATSAAGVFGFTRASAEALVRATPPPATGAAGSSVTTRGGE